MMKSVISRVRRFLHSDSEGSALVEMALVLPVMMLLITGTCSLGLVLNNFLVLTNAVQNGAMQAATGAGQTTSFDPCQTAATAIAAAAPTLAPANITLTFNFSGVPSGTAQPASFVGLSSATCAGLSSYMTANTTVTVTATYPTQFIIYGWAPGSINLKTTTAEMAQ